MRTLADNPYRPQRRKDWAWNPISDTVTRFKNRMKPIDISGKYAAIDETTASMEELTDWYNEYSGSTQIKKFSNRAVAERMVSKTKQAMDQFARTASDSTKQQTKKENDDMSKKATKTASKKTTSNGTTSGSLSGMTLHPKTKENPRREGTNGFKSFAIVLKNPGISYNDYIDKGGRNVDARWDEAHGYLELRAGKGVAKAAPAPKAKAAAKKNGKAKAKPAATVETADQAPS